MNTLPAAWLHRLPSGWEWAKLNRVAHLGTGHTPDRTKPEYWVDCTIPWVTAADLSARPSAFVPLEATAQHVSPLGVANSAAVVHPRGTVMFCRTASVGLFCITGREMATTQAFVTWTPGPRLDARYLLYVIAGMGTEFDRLAYGSTHLTIYMPDLEAVRIPLPPLEEQRRIADFLDDQVARIDNIIAARQQQADWLRASVEAAAYAEVVGAALTDRRPSGMFWTDSLPLGWGEPRICQVARMGTGHTPSRSEPEFWEDCDIPWLTTADVHRFRADEIDGVSDTVHHISRLGLSNSAAVLHPKGTVALSRTASAGFSVVMEAEMATSQDYATWKCGPSLDNYFLLWCLRAMRRDIMGRLATGSTHKTIYFPELMSIRVPLPSRMEQTAAVEAINSLVSGFRSVSSAIVRVIELLQESKRSLISAAVSGEFDVSTASGRGVPA